MVRYLSTRDPRPAPATHSFDDVLLAGLAEDGGLFVPERLPNLGGDALSALSGLPYAELAARVVGLFAGGGFGESELRRLCAQAYGSFRHAASAAEPVSPDVAPMIVTCSPRCASAASNSRPTSCSAKSLKASVGP